MALFDRYNKNAKERWLIDLSFNAAKKNRPLIFVDCVTQVISDFFKEMKKDDKTIQIKRFQAITFVKNVTLEDLILNPLCFGAFVVHYYN